MDNLTVPALNTKELPSGEDEQLQQVCFKLADSEYGIDIFHVREIIKPVENMTPVPQAPFFVEGVIDLRGDIIPILDLKKRFDLGKTEMGKSTRIIVVKLAGTSGANTLIVGFLVDQVTEVLRVKKSEIQPAPGKVMGIDSEYIWGVGKRAGRLIMLLDVERMLLADTK
ncbi:MAG TPA: chemotaxis protein CheW [Candidatus Limnocylindrales bacterium]|nr:chemotaxis protein CheW [Candidatus Limnocylindrales bacterium]